LGILRKALRALLERHPHVALVAEAVPAKEEPALPWSTCAFDGTATPNFGTGTNIRVHRTVILARRKKQTFDGLRPSLSTHVRWCERRAPVKNCVSGIMVYQGHFLTHTQKLFLVVEVKKQIGRAAPAGR
jgi:hypothetical protein